MEQADTREIELKPMITPKTRFFTRTNFHALAIVSSIFISLLSLTALTFYIVTTSIPLQIKHNHYVKDNEIDFKFSQFMVEHNKIYRNMNEYMERKNIWKDNFEYINNFNEAGYGSQLSMNGFGDLSNEEFKGTYLGYSNPKSFYQSTMVDDTPESDELPSYVNWHEHGCVTPVKDQGQCGSCWAFSTTGAIESAVCIKTGQLYSLSEQELVDCDRSFNMGCNGGTMEAAFQFVNENGGLCTEEDYPYEAMDDYCQDSGCNKFAAVKNFKMVQPGNVKALKKALATHGPVSVALDGGDPAFRFYSGGVLSGPCATELDHAVLAVGYGFDEVTQQEYWYVKNSWGPMWGDSGYIKVAMNVMGEEGECGILLDAVYPVV